MFGTGEFSGPNFADVLSGGGVCEFAEIAELFEEAGFERGVQSEHIGADEDLSGAAGAGTDADGGEGEAFGDSCGDVGGE